MKDECINGLPISTESVTTDQDSSRDLHTKYEIMLQKYNENLRVTEDLLRRIIILEQGIAKSNEC